MIRPYVLRDEILVDGAYLEFSKIRSLKIKETERDASKTVDAANNNISPNVIVFLSIENVISGDGYTTDLTRSLIKEVRESISDESKKEAPPVKLASDNKKVLLFMVTMTQLNQKWLVFSKRLDWNQLCYTRKQVQAERLLKKSRQIVMLDMRLFCTRLVT